MKQRTIGLILGSVISAVLALAPVPTGAAVETRSAHVQMDELPHATLQNPETRLPFVGTNAPAMDLATETTQPRAPQRLGPRSGSTARSEPVYAAAARRRGTRAVAADQRSAVHAGALDEAQLGLPQTHSNPPPFSVS